MKFNSLHFGKAMSAALFILLLNVAGMKNALAQTQIATLQHNDSISVYYGINALVSAHTAATTGDVITLSEGSFNCCNITKAITLRGAGCRVDTVAHTVGTTVPGNFQLNVPASDTAFLTIEGILFPGEVGHIILRNPRFIRCNFNYFKYHTGGGSLSMQNAQFINCLIKQMTYAYANNTQFINSVIYSADCYHANSSYGETYYNSIVRYSTSSSMQNAVAYNSIVICGNTASFPANSSTFFNCIGIRNGLSVNMFQHQVNSTNLLLNTYSDVFDTWTGTFSYEEEFILNDSIASSFLGNDGTQVGIHGGSVPYDPRPSYMVVKRYNVANKSDHEGKLSVDIELIPSDE